MQKKAAGYFPWQYAPSAPPLQILLLWQSLSLFYFLGILALRWTWPCVCAAALLFFIDTRLRASLPFCLAALLFVAGLAIAHAHLEERPPHPPWSLTHDQRPLSRLWEGTVTKVQGLPDKRMRVFLDNIESIEPTVKQQSPERHPLTGKGILTWDFSKLSPQAPPPIRPIQGQRIRFTSKLYASESFRNFFAPSYGFYWQSQGVFWRFWTRGKSDKYTNTSTDADDKNTVHITGIADKAAKTRESIRRHFEQAIFAPHAQLTDTALQARAFLPALLFGDKFFLNTRTMTLMAEGTLIHSLALSGQHLALAYLIACFFIFILRSLFPLIYLTLPKKHLLACACLCVAALYVWIGNTPPSLLRASTMLTAGFVLFWYAKPNDTLADILLITISLLSLYNPMILFDVGFQLSALCVGSIALIAPLLQRIPTLPAHYTETAPVQGLVFSLLRSALQIFIISLVIQVVMMPIFFLYFPPNGEWFILNVLWLPILSLWVLPLTALSCVMAYLFPHAPFVTVLISLTSLPCEWLILLLQCLEQYFLQSAVLRPHWTVLPAFATLCIAMALLLGHRQEKKEARTERKNTGREKYQKSPCPPYIHRLLMASAFCFCIAPLLRWTEHWVMNMEMIDVGQGQAIYVHLPGGQRVLVDGGGGFSPRFDVGKALVVPRLTANAPPHMHILANSHPDADHSRGLLGVMESMNTDTLYTNGQKWSDKDAARYDNMGDAPPMRALYAGMHIPLASPALPFLPRYTLEVVHPPQHMAATSDSNNNASLVLRLVEHKGTQRKGLVLLCGDIQKRAIRTLLASEQDISADVIIVPHHGAQSSLVPALYDAVRPRFALVSAGRHNSYGFPNLSVRNTIESRNITLLSTGEHGAVNIQFWPRFIVTTAF